MKLFELAEQGGTCPDCGAPLLSPAPLDGDESEASPHRCGGTSQAKGDAEDLEQAGDPDQSGADGPRVGQLVDPPSPSVELNSDLQDQEAARTVDPSESPSEPKPGQELRENTAKSLRERGYLIEEDAHGLRISSMSGARGGGSQLSASDVVSMAAELGGGVQPAANLQTCAKCEARTPPGEAHCQWCGEPFLSAEP